MDKLFTDKILMCRPTQYGIKYSINPWMDVDNDADYDLAQQQWQQLHHTIIKLGGWVEYCTASPRYPDQVFTANAALIIDLPYIVKQAIMSRFKHEERQGEEEGYRECLSEHMLTIDLPKDISFEGAGDALWAGHKKLFCGYGFRTDKESYKIIGKHLLSLLSTPGIRMVNMIMCELVDPYFYHIDTCFCPLNARQGIYYPGAFSEETRDKMNACMDLYDIPEEEARQFACNAVVIQNNVIIPSGCPSTRDVLSLVGFEVYDVPMSEFIKSGGACKCLTLKL